MALQDLYLVGKLLLIYIYNFHVLSHLLLIYICKLHWKGFYMTCPVGSSCPYTQGLHTVDIDYAICRAAFGLEEEEINAQIENTIAIYGGRATTDLHMYLPCLK